MGKISVILVKNILELILLNPNFTQAKIMKSSNFANYYTYKVIKRMCDCGLINCKKVKGNNVLTITENGIEVYSGLRKALKFFKFNLRKEDDENSLEEVDNENKK